MSAGYRSQKLPLWADFSFLNDPLGVHPILPLGSVLVKIFGSAKTDPVRFKWGFGEGLLKDKFAFFEAYKNPIPKRKKQPAKRPFL